jgi:hypothetical protein
VNSQLCKAQHQQQQQQGEEANVVKQCMSWEPKTTQKKNQPTSHQQPAKSRVKMKNRIKSKTSATEGKKAKRGVVEKSCRTDSVRERERERERRESRCVCVPVQSVLDKA